MRLLFAPLLFVLIVACGNPQPEAPPPPPKPVYYFYPRANVYFDTVNKDYLFLGTDGQTWTTVKQMPAVVQGLMDKRVLLDSAANPVWKDNSTHRLVYSTMLYASPSDTVAKKAVPPLLVIDSAKKEKKGLAKFFSRLFGKKKKEGEEKQKNK